MKKSEFPKTLNPLTRQSTELRAQMLGTVGYHARPGCAGAVMYKR